MMEIQVNQTQKKASAWKKSLVKLSDARDGYIQIAYQNEQNQRVVGYLPLTDIELTINGETLSMGEYLALFDERQQKFEEAQAKLEKQQAKVDKFIKKLGGTLE